MPELELSPKQAEILDALRMPADERPSFDSGLAEELRAELVEGTTAVAEGLGEGERLFVNKQKLKVAHMCEGLTYSQDREIFSWTPAKARGTLAHRAIERVFGSGYRLAPLDAVIGLFDYLERDGDHRTPAEFLRGLDAGERAELVTSVSDAVTKFTLDFPPLKTSWKPRVESPQNLDLHGGKVALRGKVDLAVGAPAGLRSGVFIADLKSGYEHGSNIYDVRFYALLETIVRGVPPFRVAVYYLDSGTADVRDVTPELLLSESRRVVDGISKYRAALSKRLEALDRNPNSLCRSCLLYEKCEPGQASVAERRDEL